MFFDRSLRTKFKLSIVFVLLAARSFRPWVRRAWQTSITVDSLPAKARRACAKEEHRKNFQMLPNFLGQYIYFQEKFWLIFLEIYGDARFNYEHNSQKISKRKMHVFFRSIIFQREKFGNVLLFLRHFSVVWQHGCRRTSHANDSRRGALIRENSRARDRMMPWYRQKWSVFPDKNHQKRGIFNRNQPYCIRFCLLSSHGLFFKQKTRPHWNLKLCIPHGLRRIYKKFQGVS